MANVVGIMGDSGSGKTTAFRNIDPGTTMYVDCDKKGLSWRGWKKDFNKENKNYVVTDEPSVALNILMKVSKLDEYKHIKTIVFDTINGLMIIPNLVGLLLLSGQVVKLKNEYFAERLPARKHK